MDCLLFCSESRFSSAPPLRQLKNAGKQRRGNVEKSGLPLLEEGIDNVLFLLHVFLSFFESVALAFNIDDSAVMQDTVEDSSGNGDIGEDLVPLGKGFVGSKDRGGFLISVWR